MAVHEKYSEIIDVCWKFAAREIGTAALAYDLEPDSHGLKEIWTKSCEVGIPGLLIPEEFGGAGQSALCSALVLNVLASECAGMASLFANHFVACHTLVRAGGKEIGRCLQAIANPAIDEPAIAAVVFPSDEEEDPARIVESEGRLFLSGTTALTGNVSLAKYASVFVKERDDEITCILVEGKTPGISVGEGASLPGLKVNSFASVTFKEVEIGERSLVAERGSGRELMESAQDLFFGFVAAIAMGTAHSAYEKAASYARERYQFGKTIINHPEIQRMLGTMRMKLDVGRAAYMSAFDGEERNAGLIKAYCADAALEIAVDAIQIHGGYGYMHEYGVEKIMRD
ncbi:MAG: acyl-CoA dehydrogenase family protein, partial [Thermodesulfobacteriota bacterium]|nr:acyl-CoA dehydrogenase family protein [Thermodesulfobacteriota bacterium]